MRSALAAFLCLLAFGCSKPECVDRDGDELGAHCSAGADCDDTNPLRGLDCESVPAPDCDAFPDSPGCPCFAGTVVSCYPEDPATLGVGACRAGVTICTNGFYGLCKGMVGVGAESCNGLDDDCDGEVDEFVLSPCGGCDPLCVGDVWGPGGTPFGEDEGLDRLSTGAVQLARVETTRDSIFFANTGEGTVSRLSSSEIREVSRHQSGGVAPTRVAVDYLGDAFVTNEAPGARGSITKLGGTSAGCVDRDASGTIETSNGPSVVLPLEDDECVVFSAFVGADDERPSALAIDGSLPGGGDPWVGLARAEAVVHLDGSTGAELERIAIPGFSPFSAAFDGRGYLWLASERGELVRLDRSQTPPSIVRHLVDLECYLTHAIAIDADGAILATGQNCDSVYRFVPSTSAVTAIATSENPRSLAIVGDLAYVSHTAGRVSELSTQPLRMRRLFDAWGLGASPLETIALAVDPNGFVFAASARGGAGVGLATRIDPATGSVTHQIPLGVGPRALGDGSGRALRGSFAELGSTQAVFPGCRAGETVSWENLYVDLEPGTRSSVVVSARTAETVEGLASKTFVTVATFPGATSPMPLDLPTGTALELRLELSSSARDSSPIVRRIGIERSCIVVIE